LKGHNLVPDQVFAYDSNDNAVILQHQCPGWCSSCQQCQTTTTQNIDHHYTSGDIDLLGMFPIHKTGAKVGTCGSLSQDPKLIPGNKYGYLDLAVFTA
jgi:hypothetical protein